MVNTLEQYLAVYKNFLLGNLTTESFHPLTQNLSDLTQNNLDEALEVLSMVDADAISIIPKKLNEILLFKKNIQKVLESGHKIFLCGCGATGRLSLVMEYLFRQFYKNTKYQDQVVSFMAGGDVALIKSLESFEDNDAFGRKQLNDLGFKDGDMLIASTEGGETTFVIAAALEAATISKKPSYFLYCNEDEKLMHIERSKQAIINKNLIKLNLTCGPMALSGSTRMQATTVMMYAIGLAMLYTNRSDEFVKNKLVHISTLINDLDYQMMTSLTQEEAKLYLKNQKVIYQTSPDIGLTILTDTTERSPTFSLDPFENFDSDQHSALCYLTIKGVPNSQMAWQLLLGRNPRCLNWAETGSLADEKRLLGFDISDRGMFLRSKKNYQHVFIVEKNQDELVLQLGGATTVIDITHYDLLDIHLILKILLNAHSTAMMGILGRYQDNMMTWVRASNLKLIDRAIRYAKKLLENRGANIEYEIVAKTLFECLPMADAKNPIVKLIFENLSKKYLSN